MSLNYNALAQLWDEALDATMDKVADGNATNAVYNKLVAQSELYTVPTVGQVPTHVSTSAWEAAIRKHPQPKKGKNIAAEKDWINRCKEWRKRVDKKIEDAKQKAQAKTQLFVQTTVKTTGQLPVTQQVLETAGEELWNTLADSWEDHAEQPVMHVENLVKRVKIDPKGTINFELPHGHEVLATSRKYCDRFLRFKAMLECLSALKEGEARPVVFDIGAGASGVQRSLEMMQKYAGGRDIYWHCTFPIIPGCGDLERDYQLDGTSLLGRDIAGEVNWVEKTKLITTGKVNVCRHRARDCSCLSLYTRVNAMSVHTPYYFGWSDWHQLFQWIDNLRIVQHIPYAMNQPVPSHAPEFRWVDACESEALSWLQRWRAKVTKWLTRVPQVAFVPLRNHGTIYMHPNPKPMLDRGGMHIPSRSLCRFYDWATDTDLGRAIMWTAPAAGATAMLAGGLKRSWPLACLGLTLSSAPYVVQMLTALAQTVMPTAFASFTIQATNGRDVAVKGEPLGHMYFMRRIAANELRPRVITPYAANQELAAELAAMYLLGAKKDATALDNAAAARCLREQCTPLATEMTVKRAKEIVSALGNESAPSQSSNHFRPVGVVPASALGRRSPFKTANGLISTWVPVFMCVSLFTLALSSAYANAPEYQQLSPHLLKLWNGMKLVKEQSSELLSSAWRMLMPQFSRAARATLSTPWSIATLRSLQTRLQGFISSLGPSSSPTFEELTASAWF